MAPDPAPPPPARTLPEAYAQARAAWPSLAVSEEEFCAAARSRGAEGELHAEDLLLALACGSRRPEALEAFERTVMPHARAALLARREASEAVEEALQQLRERLFVAGKIAEYSGRGPLASWARMAAVRLSLNLKRGKAPQPTGDAGLSQVMAPAIAPEFGFVKAAHRGDFKLCFEQAFNALPERARAVLRLNLLESLSTAQIAKVYRVDGSTVRRWLAEARETLLKETRALLQRRLGLEAGELDSLIGLLLTQLDESVRRIVGGAPPG
jgi:RNA polymerase sigma-70 factor (ECF subfamily)